MRACQRRYPFSRQVSIRFSSEWQLPQSRHSDHRLDPRVCVSAFRVVTASRGLNGDLVNLIRAPYSAGYLPIFACASPRVCVFAFRVVAASRGLNRELVSLIGPPYSAGFYPPLSAYASLVCGQTTANRSEVSF